MSHIEVIGPEGDIRFVELDTQGVLNIGAHPDNHIVIDAPGVEDFHAMLDARSAPFQLVNFAENGIKVNGEIVDPNLPARADVYDRIEIGGYTLLMLPEGAEGGSARAASRLEAMPARGGPAHHQRAPLLATARPTPASGGGRPLGVMPDQLDDVIQLDINERSATVDAEQVAVFNLSVNNGGPLVAGFDVYVDGLPAEWTTISNPQFNLNEGRRATFTVSVSAPRGIDHRAGGYPFSVIVVSPNYPDSVASRTALFTLNAFYEFDMSELDPRSLTVRFPKNKQTALTAVTLSNAGNSELTVRLEGADDERACLFEFDTADSINRRSKQVELKLKPGTEQTVVARITPNERYFYRFRAKNHPFTLTANPVAAGILPQSASGQLHSRPLFGPGTLFLFLAALLTGLVWLLRPQVNLLEADRVRAIAGESVAIRWEASPFTNVRIEPDIGDVGTGSGTKTFKPLDTKLYKLTGENLLSRLLPFLVPPQRDIAIAVEPVRPTINDFKVSVRQALVGESVTVYWDTLDATELTLLTNGAPETINAEQIGKGQRKPTLLADTRFELIAKNRYGQTLDNQTVRVFVPTPPPTPTPPPPVIVRFDVKPTVITAGQEIQIDWEVTGADRVTIEPLQNGASSFPVKGSIGQKPDRNIAYFLTAALGNIEVKRQITVIVGPAPTATPPPVAPRIEFFTANFNEVVLGSDDAKNLKVTWSVVGDSKSVELSGPDIGKITNLPKNGSVPIVLAKTSLLVLTALGEKDAASQVLNIRVNEPTPTPTATPTGTPVPTGTPPPTATPTATPHPLPVIVSFLASSGENPARASEVTQLPAANLPPNTFQYEVLAGAKVKLTWNATGADEVKLNEGGVPTAGEFIVLATTDGQSQKLSAINKGGKADRFVVFKLRDRPIPPPPGNFAGPVNKNPPLKFSWSYPAGSLDAIVGFRLYRSPATGAPFTRLADENVLGTGATAFEDGTPAPTCGRAYYLVAVYVRADQTKAESQPSPQSWYAGACP